MLVKNRPLADWLLSIQKSPFRCSVCGRPLTDNESIARGIGPVCIQKGGLGSGWFAPPRGTHGPGSQGGKVGSRTAGQIRAKLKRDFKRKTARVDELRARGDKLALQHGDLMEKLYELKKKHADWRGHYGKAKWEAESKNIHKEAAKIWDKLTKNENEYWKVANSIREGALETVGVTNPADFKINMGRLRKGREELQKGSDAFAALVGRGTLDGKMVTMHTTKGYRGHYSNDGVYLPPLNRRSKVVVHELGHWLEDNDPEVHNKALAFLETRTKGESAILLSRATGDIRYRADEITKKDKFMRPYTGKIYRGEYATEIISMGLEHMYSDPVEFAKTDPSHFDFIYNLMRGK